MVRLNRAQQQERTRAAVLVTASEEFTEHGYADAKIDRIAERAELTRGAVYSNFPSKRALYLAVLVDLVERPADEQNPPAPPAPPASTAAALGAFARVWLERLPLADATPAGGHLRLRSLTGVLDDPPARAALAQLIRLEVVLLGLALEAHQPPATRRVPQVPRLVRLAELVLTLLNGSGGFAEAASGIGDPFDVARACEHLAGIDLADTWNPPYLPYVSPARPVAETWTPPAGFLDRLTDRPVDLGADGVIAILGTGRLAAAEEAVRAARPAEQVTVIVVTSYQAEIGRLVRLRLGDLVGCLRRVIEPADAWPLLRLVLDDRAAVAAALGVAASGDATEVAVRIQGGMIVARAEGRGAAHAAASAGLPDAGSPSAGLPGSGLPDAGLSSAGRPDGARPSGTGT